MQTNNSIEIQLQQAILEGRKSCQLTQKALSEKSGLTQSDISKIESANANPSLKTIQRLAEAMDKEVSLKFVEFNKNHQEFVQEEVATYQIKKKSTYLDIDQTTMEAASQILTKLGIPLKIAIEMFLNQVIIKEGIPFDVSIKQLSKRVNEHLMSDEEFEKKIINSYLNSKKENLSNASDFFNQILGN